MTYKKIEDEEDDIHDAMDRITAMLSHEDKMERHQDCYFTSDVDEACRTSMVEWCFVVCDSFAQLNRETVAIAMSILDRYLRSGRGASGEALLDKQRFQLASITSFYIAVKTGETVALGIDMLVKLCRGYYTEQDFVAMELDILSSLEWRISLSTATPMEYVRHFLELLHSVCADVSDVVLENARRHADNATADVHCSTRKTSSVGVVCLAGALNDTHELSSLERDVLWRHLSRKLAGFDVATNEIRKIELRLLAKKSGISCERNKQSWASLPRSSVNMAGEQTSSPVSVSHVA